MSNATFPYQLYLVISEDACLYDHWLKVAEQAIMGGVDIIQLREKNSSTPEFLEKAKLLKTITDKHNIPLIINDNLDVAMAVDAFGIHVGNSDISPVRIRELWPGCKSLGYSIEFIEQLTNAATAASDCLGISPVFSTATKPDTVAEWGLKGLSTIRSISNKPLIAIGNMHAGNVQDVIKAGADCVAVVSAICSNPQPRHAAEQLKSLIISAS